MGAVGMDAIADANEIMEAEVGGAVECSECSNGDAERSKEGMRSRSDGVEPWPECSGMSTKGADAERGIRWESTDEGS